MQRRVRYSSELMLRSAFVGVTALLLLVSCASTSVTRLSSKTFPPKEKGCALELFTDRARIGRPYLELATLTHVTNTNAFGDHSTDAVVNAFREQACELGADAILLGHVFGGGADVRGSGQALALKFE